mmetsp:Transcript_43655/g.135505  ORF Transcript_43655/g.135505 Transcript_43655/m.135505 type:complete len:319 (+) Transcript_43655:74-1030(+)
MVSRGCACTTHARRHTRLPRRFLRPGSAAQHALRFLGGGRGEGEGKPCGRSDHLAVKDALEEDSLGSLRAHVRVRGLLRDKDTADLAEVRVDLVHLHLDGALADVEDLVGLLEELLLALLAVGLEGGQRHGLVVAGVHAAALGVQEGAGAVGGHLELAAPREARLELAAVALRHEALDREEERHVLAVGQLNGRRQGVDAVVLLEDNGVGAKLAIDEGQGVGLAGEELGGHKLRALVGLRLNGPGFRLEAHIRELGTALHGDGGALALNCRAAVGEARALDLVVRQLAVLLRGERAGRGRREQSGRQPEHDAKAEDRR